MPKKIKTTIKLQIQAGKANPAPPVGPALGQHGLNIAEFCQKFNAKTQKQMGNVIPVLITVYEDRTYSFVCKTPPASDLIKKALKLQSGAHNPLTEKVGTLTEAQVKEIATIKLPDMNTDKLESAMEMIKGTARQMGVLIK